MHVCRHIYICIHMYVYEYMCQHMLPSWFWHYVLPLVVWDSSMLVTCFALRCVFVGMSAWLFGSAVKHFGKTKCKCVPQMGRIYVTQNDNKTITKLTRKPSSNTMAHWSRCGYMWLRWVCSKKRFCSKGMNARGQWKLNEWFFGWRPHVHKPLWLW